MPETLKRKRNNTSQLAVTVPRPNVKVKAPDVSVDGLNVSINGITVTVDSREFAQAIGALAGQMSQLVQSVATIQAEHGALIQQVAALAAREQIAPVVNMPAPAKGKRRAANGYDVALVRDEVDNEILGFRLRPVNYD